MYVYIKSCNNWQNLCLNNATCGASGKFTNCANSKFFTSLGKRHLVPKKGKLYWRYFRLRITYSMQFCCYKRYFCQFHSTKNQRCQLCVDGDMVLLISSKLTARCRSAKGVKNVIIFIN